MSKCGIRRCPAIRDGTTVSRRRIDAAACACGRSDGVAMRWKLKEARIKADLTQRRAGELIGKTESHYSKIERGEVDLRATEALVLCNNFNLSLAELLEEAWCET